MSPEELLKESETMQETIISYRRYLHSHPGTGFDIEDTVSFVKEKLIEMGYEPEECGRAGLVACAGEKKEGKVFLLRADMDGLPIREESELDFAAQNGRMHACGHDMHTAMLLGAARLLKQHEDEIEGVVKLMFQPAEEIFEGSHDMIKAGLLEHPTVDKALMIHVMSGMPFSPGTVIVSAPGVSAPGADIFEIKVQGKGVHGSMPNLGIDPLNAASHILIALQEIQTRELALNEQAVLTIGTMNAGTAPNVIPDSVVMSGSLRTFDEETRTFIKNRLTDIAMGTARTFRAEAEVTFKSGCPTLVNDKELSVSILKYARELLGPEKAFSVEELNTMAKDKKASGSAGSEDFAYISQEVPSIMLALAAGHPDNGYVYPQHHPMVKFDENALPSGCAVYAYTAMRWLEEHKAM
ncbi:MAG: amidohydrolase [Lachnospiraceae bacterium]|nr:amidohydrolase [Lachnospiraceae bacterium]